MAKPDMTTPSPTEKFFFEKNFLEKRDSHVRRLGANKDQVPLPDKALGVEGTTFMALERRRPRFRAYRCLTRRRRKGV
jgi:hypothetical protein